MRIDAEGRIEVAAVPRYVTIPVRIDAVTDSGGLPRFTGSDAPCADDCAAVR